MSLPNFLDMPPSSSGYDHTRRYTIEEVLAFPDDGNRYELIDGELFVAGAPRIDHQLVLMQLILTFGNYLMSHDLVWTLFTSPADITYGPRTLVQPDLFVIHPDETGRTWDTIKRLRLTIEVISPSTARWDRIKKRQVYQQNGVETYWIVDPDQRHVEVWTPMAIAPVIETETIRWQHAPECEPLVIDLPALWWEARVR